MKENMKWYYLDHDGQVAGPMSEADLRELRASGQLADDSLICCEGTEQWISYTDFSGLAATTPNSPKTFKFTCTNCNQHIQAGIADVGSTANCPACEHLLQVPEYRTQSQLKAQPAKRAYSKLMMVGGTVAAVLLIGLLFPLATSLAKNKNRSVRSEKEPAQHDTVITGSSEENHQPNTESPKQDYDRANRIAAARFKELWEVAASANQSSDPSTSAVNIIAAVNNVDWSACSPELREAAVQLADDDQNRTMSEFRQNLVPFLEICQRYVDF